MESPRGLLRIPAEPNRAGLDSEDLFRLGQLLSRRIHLTCPKCRADIQPSAEEGSLRIGSSPDLGVLDPTKQGKPRLLLRCAHCLQVAGFVQGDGWTVRSADDLDAPDRWNHLELDGVETED
ncbi:MAG: hypothetical protein ACKO5K_16460 [Armatimonadota bacterium]